MKAHVMTRIIGVLAVLAGAAIAWVDSRPGWDDTGITAAALLVTAGLAVLAGLRWWVATVLVVSPLLLAEIRTAGWGLMFANVFVLAGAAGGALLRRALIHS